MAERADGPVPSSRTATERDTLSIDSKPPRPAAARSVGDVIAGKYQVEQIIGEGGMGVVVSALHLGLQERVALKFLHGAGKGAASERFRREAKIAFRLRGEHIARLLDIGTLEDGDPFLVMELLRGETLSGRLARLGPMPLAEACDVVLQVCEGLAEAHALGIVHRDLKPSNLMLTERPDGSTLVKILDFGIAKLLAGKEAALAQGSGILETHSSAMLGSPAFMSPEQFRSAKEVDERTDIWALGVLLHEITTGQLPFRGPSAADTLRAILDHPPDLLLRERGAPDAFSQVVARCLEKSRDRRWPNVAQFAAAIAPFASPSSQPSPERVARVLSGSIKTPSHPPATTLPSGATIRMELPATHAAPAIFSERSAARVAVTGAMPEDVAPTLRVPEQQEPAPRRRSGRGVWFGLGGVGVIAALAIVWSQTGATRPAKRRTAEPPEGAVTSVKPSASAVALASSSAGAAPSASAPTFSFSITFGSASAKPAIAKLSPGQHVSAQRPDGSWQDAVVVETRPDQARVHWPALGQSQDAWLDAAHIRP